ncbi:MAG: hypothetical protein AAF950_07110 [Pseudomonadota bacterium]
MAKDLPEPGSDKWFEGLIQEMKEDEKRGRAERRAFKAKNPYFAQAARRGAANNLCAKCERLGSRT